MSYPSVIVGSPARSKSRALYILYLLCLLCFADVPASAQNRPLRTSDAEILPPGTLRAEVGFDFLQDVSFPLTGLTGDLTSVGVLTMRMGVGKIVEVQLQGAVQNFLDVKKQSGGFVTPILQGACTTPTGGGQVTGGCSAHDTGDFSLFTKVRIFSESGRRPSLALHFGFKMPNSKERRGIGTNTTEVFGSLILQKHFGNLNLFGDLGLAILQAPNTQFTQNDVFTYGGAFVYPFYRRVNFVGEVNGRKSMRTITAGLVGTESRSQARLGFQIFAGGFQWDLAGIAGLTSRDAKSGFTFGLSKDIRLFGSGKIQ